MELPMVEKSKTDEDKDGKAVIPSNYQWYVCHPFFIVTPVYCPTFAICMCARYQARPTEKHLNAVKRIFWYLKGTVHWGLWYPKDSSIVLTVFAYADHVGCQDTRRSTSGSIQLLGDSTWIWSSKSRKALRYPVNQLADIFTKALGRERIDFLINKLGMRSFTPETLKQLADEVDE
ncbi:hypothetical protein Tco_0000274 [Tanacetum coccineum]